MKKPETELTNNYLVYFQCSNIIVDPLYIRSAIENGETATDANFMIVVLQQFTSINVTKYCNVIGYCTVLLHNIAS